MIDSWLVGGFFRRWVPMESKVETRGSGHSSVMTTSALRTTKEEKTWEAWCDKQPTTCNQTNLSTKRGQTNIISLCRTSRRARGEKSRLSLVQVPGKTNVNVAISVAEYTHVTCWCHSISCCLCFSHSKKPVTHVMMYFMFTSSRPQQHGRQLDIFDVVAVIHHTNTDHVWCPLQVAHAYKEK